MNGNHANLLNEMPYIIRKGTSNSGNFHSKSQCLINLYFISKGRDVQIHNGWGLKKVGFLSQRGIQIGAKYANVIKSRQFGHAFNLCDSPTP